MSDSEEEVEYEEETVSLGDHSFRLTTVSHMPLHILMKNQSIGVEISGQKVWCGSVGIASYIKENAEIVNNKYVIELGAGTGILGMLCSRLGATKIFLTDHDEISLRHMAHDSNLNGIDATVTKLDWFSPSTKDIPMVSGNEFLIVAGDVLYKKQLLEPFFATVRLLLDTIRNAGLSGQMLLCHIPRANVEHELVRNAAIEKQLHIEEIPRDDTWRDSIRQSKSVSNDDEAVCPDHDINRAKLYMIQAGN